MVIIVVWFFSLEACFEFLWSSQKSIHLVQSSGGDGDQNQQIKDTTNNGSDCGFVHQIAAAIWRDYQSTIQYDTWENDDREINGNDAWDDDGDRNLQGLNRDGVRQWWKPHQILLWAIQGRSSHREEYHTKRDKEAAGHGIDQRCDNKDDPQERIQIKDNAAGNILNGFKQDGNDVTRQGDVTTKQHEDVPENDPINVSYEAIAFKCGGDIANTNTRNKESTPHWEN